MILGNSYSNCTDTTRLLTSDKCVGGEAPCFIYYGKLMNRLSIFQKETQPRKAIHMTLVSANGFLDGKYASVFQNIITGEQLFQ